MDTDNLTKQISLTQGKFAVVDAEDYKHLMRWKWCFSHGYAIRNQKKGEGTNPSKVYMHRKINKTPDHLLTDHINRNKLDNRKENLRNCSKSQNNQNTEPFKNKSSRYKGVYWSKKRAKWIAQIGVENKLKYLGGFVMETDAAKAYDKASVKYFGKFSRINIQ